MQIHGFQKLTLLDYPEHIAATVFTGGCNFRCPFCHNKDLVIHPECSPLIPEDEVLEVLKKRRGMLQGVCITGGEPTLQSGLREFIIKIKELGYLVKLDTNGYRPEVLARFIEEELLDYIAMDVKASPKNYSTVTGCPGVDFSRIRESVRRIMESNVRYEFRTTVVKGLHRADEFEEIGKLLAGCRVYYLQGYRENENVLQPGFAAFSRVEMETMAALAGKYIDRVEIRGLD